MKILTYILSTIIIIPFSASCGRLVNEVPGSYSGFIEVVKHITLYSSRPQFRCDSNDSSKVTAKVWIDGAPYSLDCNGKFMSSAPMSFKEKIKMNYLVTNTSKTVQRVKVIGRYEFEHPVEIDVPPLSECSGSYPDSIDFGRLLFGQTPGKSLLASGTSNARLSFDTGSFGLSGYIRDRSDNRIYYSINKSPAANVYEIIPDKITVPPGSYTGSLTITLACT